MVKSKHFKKGDYLLIELPLNRYWLCKITSVNLYTYSIKYLHFDQIGFSLIDKEDEGIYSVGLLGKYLYEKTAKTQKE